MANCLEILEETKKNPPYDYVVMGRVNIKKVENNPKRDICAVVYRNNQAFIIPRHLSPDNDLHVIVQYNDMWLECKYSFFCVYDYEYWGLDNQLGLRYVSDIVAGARKDKSYEHIGVENGLIDVSFKVIDAEKEVINEKSIANWTVFQVEDQLVMKYPMGYGIVAVPPLTQTLVGKGEKPKVNKPKGKSTDKPKGYHLADIKKSQYGTVDKIVEEVRELEDAVDQGVKLMVLQELSDIIGAIEGYLESSCPGIVLEDLIKMKDLTRRAFEAGHRK